MASNKYLENLLLIQKKILQVLRIKKKLEERRELLIKRLANSSETSLNGILASLQELYKRELRVLAYCDEGIAKAIEILDEVGALVEGSEGFFSRLKSGIKNKLKREKAESEYPLLIISLLRFAYSELRKELTRITGSFGTIKELLALQSNYVRNLAQKVNSGYIIERMKEDPDFIELERFHNEEVSFVRNVARRSGKGRVLETVANIKDATTKLNEAIERNPVFSGVKRTIQENPRLAKVYGCIFPLPTLSTGGAIGVYFLGPIGYPVFWALTFIIEFAPPFVIWYSTVKRQRVIA